MYFITLIQLPMHMHGPCMHMVQLLITFSNFFSDTVVTLSALNGSKMLQKTPFGPYLQFLVLQF
jgi:hypothetical protein